MAFFVTFSIYLTMEASFAELKAKQVINTVDGKCLGRITDMVFDVVTTKVLGFIVPQRSQKLFNIFSSNKDLFIPFECVYKIGIDAILVELYVEDKKKDKKDNCKC